GHGDLQPTPFAMRKIRSAHGLAPVQPDPRQMGLSVTPVFVSVDPERDTPEVLAEFVPYVHPDMIGLTGDQAAVDQAKKAFKVYAAKNGEGEDYLYDHSTFSYLMGPDGSFWEFFRRDLTPEQLADRVACFVNA
ncbi:MAG: SCO family protein, partial [Pseudomonadota bacterium]